MEAKDVPQWVTQSFVRSLVNAGATASHEEILSCCGDLIRAWRAPDRFEHGFQHLLDMLSRVDSLAPETPNPDLVRIATWFHGIVFSTSDLDVYTRNGGEDEHASAQIAQDQLTLLGLSPETIKVVKKLIIGLKKRGLQRTDTGSFQPINEAENCIDTGSILLSETGKFEAIDMNQHALCDAHLGALAVEPQRYRKYALRIREEYAHIPLTHFLAARIKIVQRLLARKKLFMSPLASSWEDTARQNLTVELAALNAELIQARESAQLSIKSADDTDSISSAGSTQTESINAKNTSSRVAADSQNGADSQDEPESTKSFSDVAQKAASQRIADQANQEDPSENQESSRRQEDYSGAAKSFTSRSEERESEFEMVQSISGDTIVRKAPRAPLSSLEIIDDDFDPKRSAKVKRAAASLDYPNQHQHEEDTAEQNRTIKHGMESEPDF